MEAQRRFIAYAAHELRAPLTALLGEITFTLRRERDANREALVEAHDATERLCALSEDLLALARLGASSEVDRAEINLDAALTGALDDLRGVSRDAPAAIRVAPTALRVFGHPSDLRRLLRNLLENALRHTPAGEEVRVETWSSGEGSTSRSTTPASASRRRTASGCSSPSFASSAPARARQGRRPRADHRARDRSGPRRLAARRDGLPGTRRPLRPGAAGQRDGPRPRALTERRGGPGRRPALWYRSDMAIRFDLSPYPAVVPYRPLPDEAPHMTRARTLCEAAASLVELPPGVGLDEFEGYATGRFCALGDVEPAEIRLRVVGIANGQNAKKNREYLGISYVALDAAGKVVGWSEDHHAMGRNDHASARAYWTAVNADAAPPKPKTRAQDCGILSFVEGEGDDVAVTAITPEIRAAVARAVEAMPPLTVAPAKTPRSKG